MVAKYRFDCIFYRSFALPQKLAFWISFRNGDHIHTNFKDMYQHLRTAGYFVEVLGKVLLFKYEKFNFNFRFLKDNALSIY